MATPFSTRSAISTTSPHAAFASLTVHKPSGPSCPRPRSCPCSKVSAWLTPKHASSIAQHKPQPLAEGLRFPVVIKPNIGGSGAGVTRFDKPEQIVAAVAAGELALGMDSTGIVQEFIPARGGFIVRCEVLDGKFLYAIKVHTTGESFDLCPADICRTTAGVELNRAACALDAPKSGIRVEGYEPPAAVVSDVERIMAAAGVELGGVEYLIDDRGGDEGMPLYYDINALSNFVADGPAVVGFDPFVRLVDWLVVESEKADAQQWHVEHDAALGIGHAGALAHVVGAR